MDATSERSLWQRYYWLLPIAFLAVAFLYGVGSMLWYRHFTSGANQPEKTETCAIGSYDVAAFRALIGRVRQDGGGTGGGCRDTDDPGDCFARFVKEQIDAVQQVAGPGMVGRLAAMHAVMRAKKAVLLSQTTIPPKPTLRLIGSGPGGSLTDAERAPLIQRAERFVYALDQREIGFSGPALFSGGRRTAWDKGRTPAPSGDYAVAEIAIVLADPALIYPDDSSTGAVKEEIGYVEAAWSHRSGDSNQASRPYLPAKSVHEMTSLCPRIPGWLSQPALKAATPTKRFSPNDLMREMDRIMQRPSRALP